jgi:hypothetical protein
MTSYSLAGPARNRKGPALAQDAWMEVIYSEQS